MTLFPKIRETKKGQVTVLSMSFILAVLSIAWASGNLDVDLLQTALMFGVGVAGVNVGVQGGADIRNAGNNKVK